MIKDPTEWPDFSTELSLLAFLQERFQDFKIIHVPRAQNRKVDFLPRTARAFYKSLVFIVCSIQVWISIPPLV